MEGAINWPALGALFAIIAVLGGFSRYLLALVERNNAVWTARLEKAKRDRDKTAAELDELKEEIFKHYVRREELEGHTAKVRQDIHKLFERFEGLSNDVHELIGRFKERANVS